MKKSEKNIIVTTSWDDAHKLDLKLFKLLKKYNIKGTFYIVQSQEGYKKQHLLNTKDIKNISKYFEIGAHTISHKHLINLSSREVRKEIEESKKYLEGIIKKPVDTFCYPYGEYNEEIIKILKKAKFKLARTVKLYQTSIGNDPFLLPTTSQAYTSEVDIINPKVILRYKSHKWNKIAKKQFDKVLKKGGVFHLWGHSWEIEKYNQWENLEKLLSYIGNRKEVKYLTNGELI